ncbi:MAG: hypothetical protein PHC75_03390 [Burkholderiales bacterium]|nr:hypothetical protein [Burkholderiales bacterium]
MMDNIFKVIPNCLGKLNNFRSESTESKKNIESAFLKSKRQSQYFQEPPINFTQLVKGREILSEDLDGKHGSNMANQAIHNLNNDLQELSLPELDQISNKFTVHGLENLNLDGLRKKYHDIEKNNHMDQDQKQIQKDNIIKDVAVYVGTMIPKMKYTQDKFINLIDEAISKYKQLYPNSNIRSKFPNSLKDKMRIAQKILEGTDLNKLDDLVRGTIIAPLDEQANFIKFLNKDQGLTLVMKNRIYKQTSMGFGDVKCGIFLNKYNCELLFNSPIMDIVKGSAVSHKIYEYIGVMPESSTKDQYKQSAAFVLNNLEVKSLRFEHIKMNEFGKEQYIKDIIPFIENMFKKLDINNEKEKDIKFTKLTLTQKIEHVESLMDISNAFGTAILYGFISQDIRNFAITMMANNSEYKKFIYNHLNYVPHENYTVKTKLSTLSLLAKMLETDNNRTSSQEKYFSKDEDKRDEFGDSYAVKYSLVNKAGNYRKFES